MKKIIVGSTNPVKIKCIEQAFAQMFPDLEFVINGISTPSGVADQPMNSDETLLGAQNRAENAQLANPDADFWVGIEGGISQVDNTMEAFAWIVIKSQSKRGQARSASFTLPPKITELIASGIELGEADDIVFRRKNSKQTNGAVGILTADVIDRTSYYSHAAVLALIPFKNLDLY